MRDWFERQGIKPDDLEKREPERVELGIGGLGRGSRKDSGIWLGHDQDANSGVSPSGEPSEDADHSGTGGPEPCKDVQVESETSPPPEPQETEQEVCPVPKRRKTDKAEGVKVVKRGRPKGSKDKAPRKKRAKKLLSAAMYALITSSFEAVSPAKFAESYPDYAKIPSVESSSAIANTMNILHEVDDLEPGETVEDVTLMITMSEAINGPDSVRWIEAINKEKCRLEGFKCWRPLSDAEYLALDKRRALPVAVVLTRKRDMSFKARAVCLGNRQEKDSSLDVFSPVVSHTGIRLICTAAVCDGDFIKAFDISSAFIQSKIREDIIIKLPPSWVSSNRESYVKCLKSLYGLRASPRNWYECYHAKLLEFGWISSPECPGMYRMESRVHAGKFLKLGVYVDDNILSGPCQAEAIRETRRILKEFSGTEIPCDTVTVGGEVYSRWDILGADLLVNRQKRLMKITMSRYIQKFLKRFGFEGVKPSSNPCFSESGVTKAALDAKSGDDKYPVREVVGCLNWLCTTARPDLSMPVGVLSRLVSKPTTGEMKSAIRKIARYLKSTIDEGITYSPENQQNFNRIYSRLLGGKREVPTVNLFSDASWASDFQTLKSVSGCVCYYKGTPVCWKSARQSIRAMSTYEAEWVAASDTLTLHSHNKFLEFFEPTPTDDHLLWIDSMSAIQVAQGASERPRSRHVALRFFQVKEEARRLVFCPTTLQRADPLTKVECSPSQRRLILWVCDEEDKEKQTKQDLDVTAEFYIVDSSFRRYLD